MSTENDSNDTTIPPTDWKLDLIAQLQERNKRECPDLDVLRREEEVCRRYMELEKNRAIARHQLILLEHEIHDCLVKKKGKEAIEMSLEGIRDCQRYLVPPQFADPTRKSSINLSKEIYDKNLTIEKQQKEIKSLSEALINKSAQLDSLQRESESLREKWSDADRQSMEMKYLITSLEELVTATKKENKDLMERLMAEKEKTADQMNEMNALVEGTRKLQTPT